MSNTDKNNLLDRSSIYGFNKRLDELAKEYQIAIETQILVGKKLSECSRIEGVNKYVNCRDLRLEYEALLKDRFHGMIFPEGVTLNRERIFHHKYGK